MISPDPRTRAVRSARRELRRCLPRALRRWVEQAASISESPDDARALGGTLAATAMLLAEAYAESGVRVRDRTWAMHALLRGEGAEAGATSGLENYRPWLETKLRDPEIGDSWRRLMYRWLDVVNERLTMRSYAGREKFSEHSHALVATPLCLAARMEADAPVRRFGELALRFWDLLGARAQAEIGRNRLAIEGREGFGGFFAMTGDMQPPSEDEIEKALEDFLREAQTFDAQLLPAPLRPLGAVWLDEMRSAVRRRLTAGKWPRAFRIRYKM